MRNGSRLTAVMEYRPNDGEYFSLSVEYPPKYGFLVSAVASERPIGSVLQNFFPQNVLMFSGLARFPCFARALTGSAGADAVWLASRLLSTCFMP